VEYEDRITIETPEGVSLQLALAGVGSRFAAAVIDWLIQAAIFIALLIVLVQVGDVGLAIFAVVSFLLLFGYDVAFEVLASGRTPGKRANGLRVVREGGRPITFTASAIRNLIRVIDLLPGTYLVGAISVIVSPRNQRLGDLAAGTLVVRDRPRRRREREVPWRDQRAEQAERAAAAASTWDVSAVGQEELVAVRKFLDRRYDLTTDARMQLAATLAEPLRAKVAGAPEGLAAETFLERLAAAKAART
jgi:uncharacterized RDD family membrane protein YckC